MERQPEVARKNRAQQRFNRALLDASDMAAAIHQNNALLKVLVQQLIDRRDELAAPDPTCKGLMAAISEVRNILEVIPLLREHDALKALGPQLYNIVNKET
jgi:hypothetical protein